MGGEDTISMASTVKGKWGSSQTTKKRFHKKKKNDNESKSKWVSRIHHEVILATLHTTLLSQGSLPNNHVLYKMKEIVSQNLTRLTLQGYNISLHDGVLIESVISLSRIQVVDFGGSILPHSINFLINGARRSKVLCTVILSKVLTKIKPFELDKLNQLLSRNQQHQHETHAKVLLRKALGVSKKINSKINNAIHEIHEWESVLRWQISSDWYQRITEFSNDYLHQTSLIYGLESHRFAVFEVSREWIKKESSQRIKLDNQEYKYFKVLVVSYISVCENERRYGIMLDENQDRAQIIISEGSSSHLCRLTEKERMRRERSQRLAVLRGEESKRKSLITEYKSNTMVLLSTINRRLKQHGYNPITLQGLLFSENQSRITPGIMNFVKLVNSTSKMNT